LAANNWPDDLVEVSPEDFALFMDSPNHGKMIVPGDDGYPALVTMPGQSHEEQSMANNSAERDSRLSLAAIRIAPLQDAVDLGKASKQDSDLLLAWKTYRIDVNRTDLKNPSWPSVPE
jgi:hypothetical protein